MSEPMILNTRTAHKAEKRRGYISQIPTGYLIEGGNPNHVASRIENCLTRKEAMSWLNGLGVPADFCRPLSKRDVCLMMADEVKLFTFLASNGVRPGAIAAAIYAHRLDLASLHSPRVLNVAVGDGRVCCLVEVNATGGIRTDALSVSRDIGVDLLPPTIGDFDWSEMAVHPHFSSSMAASDWPGNTGGDASRDDDDDEDLGDDDQTIMGFAGTDTSAKAEEPKAVPATVPQATSGDLADEIGRAMSAIVRDALAAKSDTNAVDEAMVRKIVLDELKGKIPLVIEMPQGDDTKAAPELAHKEYPTIFKAVAVGLNVMLIGPAGSGKTTIAEQVADALKIPFRFTGAVDSPYKLTGFVDAGGRVVRTAFRETYENGGLFLFDEIDASAPSALMAFNAALANGVADFPDAMVPRHENFYCMAAANTYGHGADRVYVGRNALDGATLDRFAVVDFDYDELLEKTLAGDEMTEWVQYVQRIRAAIFKLKLRYVVSPRATLGGARLIKAGMARKTIEEIVVWKGMAAEAREKVRAEARA